MKNCSKMVTMKHASLLALSMFGLSNTQGQDNKTADKGKNQQHPNIVLIIVDQFRADACKREGFALNTTPFLDSLAETGFWFNRAYCASPACVPSRTSLMTGRFPTATHVRSNMNLQNAFFETDLMQVLRSQGYQTALIGKNHTYMKPEMVDYWKEYSHLGVTRPLTEEDKAFNKYLEGTHFYMEEKAAPFSAEKQLPAKIVSDAKNWMEDEQRTNGKPFFLYISIPEPHNPYQVSEPYYSMFPPQSLPPVSVGPEVLPTKGNKWVLQKEMMDMGYPEFEKQIPRIRSNYYGMLRLIDDQVKSLVDYTRENGLDKNTIFIFIADHGDFTGEYGLIKKGVEVPECLSRVPMIWAGPGIVSGKVPSNAHVSNVDIMPTICDIIGTPIPRGVQGRSLWPMLQGKDYPKAEFSSVIVQQGFGGLHFTDFKEYDPYTQDGTLTKGKKEFDELNTWSQSGTLRMLRKGDWKLVYDMQGVGQLYNLIKDPSEVHNLFGDAKFASKQMELLQDIMAWELRTQDPLPVPIPTRNRHYGFKRDPQNYWTPYKDEPERKLKANIKNLKN